MDLNPYISTIRENLTAAAAAGDEQTRMAARVLAAAVGPAARLAIMNALADLAAEVTVALEDRVVDVRLDGQDIRVVVTGAATDEPEPEPEPPPTFTGDQGDISRITVRLFEELKGKAEEAAAAQGVSLNAFVQQAVQGALHNAARRGQWGGGPWGGPWGGDQWGGPWGGRGHRGGRDDRGDRGGKGSKGGKGGTDHGKGGGSSRVRGWVEG